MSRHPLQILDVVLVTQMPFQVTLNDRSTSDARLTSTGDPAPNPIRLGNDVQHIRYPGPGAPYRTGLDDPDGARHLSLGSGVQR